MCDSGWTSVGVGYIAAHGGGGAGSTGVAVDGVTEVGGEATGTTLCPTIEAER